MASANSAKPKSTKTKKLAAANKAGKPKRRSKQAAKQHRLRVFQWILVVFLTLAIIVSGLGVYFYISTELPDPNADFTTQNTKVYFSDGTTEIGELSVQNREVISYDQMPQSIKDAVVAAEDRSFWTNKGVDFTGILRAVWGLFSEGEITGGGSTITQQYIKTMYLSSEQTMKRKLTELVLASKLNKTESKEAVLEGYLNTIFFGRNSYGIEAASKAYFNISASQLNVGQAAVLASVINAPSNYDPALGEQQAQNLHDRYNYVIEGMLEEGTIDQATYDQFHDQMPEIFDYVQPNTYGGPNGFLLNMVSNELQDLGFSETEINGGGLKIVTTFDAKAQQAAIDAVNSAMSQIEPIIRTTTDANGNEVTPSIKDLHTALVSIDVKTGEVLALYGGPDFVESSQNWATTRRYAGSTFKMYGVVAGLRNGFGLNSVLRGDTFTPEGDAFSVSNDSGEQFGPITLKKATQVSSNTAFVDMMTRIPDNQDALVKAANDAGVPEDPSWRIQGSRMVLGEGEVSPLDNTTGYATIANAGLYMETHILREVTDSSGAVVYKNETTGEQTIERNVAVDAINAASGAGSTSSKNAVDGRDLAVKTGTEGILAGQDLGEGMIADSTVTRAGWISGFTAQIATSVMMVAGSDGNQDLNPYRPSGTSGFYGAGWPTTVFNSYMETVTDGMPVESFPTPANIKPTVPNSVQTATPTPTPTSEPSETPEASQPSETATTEPSVVETQAASEQPTTDTSQPANTQPSDAIKSEQPVQPNQSAQPAPGGP